MALKTSLRKKQRNNYTNNTSPQQDSLNSSNTANAGAWDYSQPLANPAYASNAEWDAEKQATVANNGGRKMNRIDKPKSAGEHGSGDSDTDSATTVGKQMEMEAGNSIKYRTCSWPKVIYSTLREKRRANTFIDSRSPVFRVHLSGHHVIPILLLCPWSCAWLDPHRRGRWNCPLYFTHYLVSYGSFPS